MKHPATYNCCKLRVKDPVWTTQRGGDSVAFVLTYKMTWVCDWDSDGDE